MSHGKEPVVINGFTYYHGAPPADDKTPTRPADSTWHDRKTSPRKGCLHCANGDSGGHYFCTENSPCQDCVDEGLTAAEDIAAGYGPNGEDTGPDIDYDPLDYID